MKMGALSFPETTRPGLAPVLVEIPGNTMAWAPERTGGWSHAQFAVVVRIKDARGREADRLSQEYALTVGAGQGEAGARGQRPLLPRGGPALPARYTAEAVAYDALAQTASIRSSTLRGAEGGARRPSALQPHGGEPRGEAAPGGAGRRRTRSTTARSCSTRTSARPCASRWRPCSASSSRCTARAPARGQRATLEIQQGAKVRGEDHDRPRRAATRKGRSQNAGVLPVNSLAPGAYTLEGLRGRRPGQRRFARRPSPWWSEAAPGPHHARRGPRGLDGAGRRDRARRADRGPPVTEPACSLRDVPGGARSGHGGRGGGPPRGHPRDRTHARRTSRSSRTAASRRS